MQKLKSFEQQSHETSVTLTYTSNDQDLEYPGKLSLDVTYVLTQKDEIIIKYDATTTKDTLCNITNHVYFNLSHHKNHLDNHIVSLQANQYLKVDDAYKPVLKENVEHSLFDLRENVSLKERLAQFKKENKMGFDHAFFINSQKDSFSAYDTLSHIGIKIDTDYPAIVFYTHNYKENKKMIDCMTDGVHGSFAAECQFEPSGIYHKELNSAILRKGELYHHEIKITPYTK